MKTIELKNGELWDEMEAGGEAPPVYVPNTVASATRTTGTTGHYVLDKILAASDADAANTTPTLKLTAKDSETFANAILAARVKTNLFGLVDAIADDRGHYLQLDRATDDGMQARTIKETANVIDPFAHVNDVINNINAIHNTTHGNTPYYCAHGVPVYEECNDCVAQQKQFWDSYYYELVHGVGSEALPKYNITCEDSIAFANTTALDRATDDGMQARTIKEPANDVINNINAIHNSSANITHPIPHTMQARTIKETANVIDPFAHMARIATVTDPELRHLLQRIVDTTYACRCGANAFPIDNHVESCPVGVLYDCFEQLYHDYATIKVFY